MDTGALRSYVDRSRELVDSAPELSERNTQIRLVQPFLTALGWELHQIAADRQVPTAAGSATVDFALLVDDEPAVLVETCACRTDLRREQAERLGRTLLATGVDRGVLTNGREFVFVAADGDEQASALDRFECRLGELPERADAVAHYARETVERSIRDGRRRRREAADALADEREAVIADVHERLVATAGDDVAERLRSESERFVDDLIASLRGDDADEARSSSPRSTSSREDAAEQTSASPRSILSREDADGKRDAGARLTPNAEAETVPDSEVETTSAAETETTADAETEPSSNPEAELDAEAERALESVAGTAGDGHPESGATDEGSGAERSSRRPAAVPSDALGAAVAEDGQYVVRLFGGRTSVWAVGHARAAMTAAQTIEYLLGRGAADGRGAQGDEPTGSLSPPWGPDGEYAVLREDAVENATIELSNGWHLDARVPVDVATAAIERLAERAGLRAMFQDEWADE